MISQISVCNMALAYLGQAPISSLQQNNETARWLQLFYEPVRDEVLRTHNWAFAAAERPLVRVRQAVAGVRENLQERVFPGRFCYKYPADALFIREVYAPENSHQPLEFEERLDGPQQMRLLITSVPQAWVCYTRRVTDETQFDPAFTKCFALALACDSALALTGDPDIAARLQQKYAWQLEEARRSNMSESRVCVA